MSNTRKSNIAKRRKLEELFAKGYEVRFNESGVNYGDPLPDDLVIWVTPPSPLQREQAVRNAQAARARVLLQVKRDPDSVAATVNEHIVSEMDLEELVEYISQLNDAEQQQEATRNVLSREDWKDIDALRDAMRQWEEAGSPTDDPEWEDLLARDQMFGDEVTEEMVRIAAAERESLKMLSRGDLESRVLEKRYDIVGNQTFMETYQNELVFYSCRDNDDRRELFFEDVEDMRSFPDEVQEALLAAFAKFITEVGEAKNSPRVADGSEQSAPPEKQETSEPSTPQE